MSKEKKETKNQSQCRLDPDRRKEEIRIAEEHAATRYTPDSKANALKGQLTKEDIKAAVGNVLSLSTPYKPVITDEECKTRVEEFFSRCYEESKYPTLETLALSLGVCRRTFDNWINGTQGPERQRICMIAKETVMAIDAELVMRRKIPEISYIFRSKCAGMVEAPQININVDAKQIDAKQLIADAGLLPDYVDGDYKIVEDQAEKK